MDEREGAEYAASMILRAKDCVRRYKVQFIQKAEICHG